MLNSVLYIQIETKDRVVAISEKLLKSTKFSILINTRCGGPRGAGIITREM